MNFLARVARFLMWLLFISWSVWLLRRLVGWMLRNAAPAAARSVDVSNLAQTTAAARRLVRDPVCGMHADETRSIPLPEGGELLHFSFAAPPHAYALKLMKVTS